MAMSKSSNTYNRVKWEDAEFPILCQTCLGNNPYLRMLKDKFGKECKICNRPFTTFRWCPGRGMRYKNTEVCQTCSKLKNVCQTCLLDLEYGLPVQVRDYALGLKDDLPKTGANRDYYIQNAEREAQSSDGTTPVGTLGRLADQGVNDMLRKLARTQPYYERNRPHICSFWVKGECKRGEECPYRHEKPTDPDDPLSDQNIKDRFYGTKDPVADKLLNRAKALPILQPPEDKSITTLYVGNLGDDSLITEKDIRDYFYQFGELRAVSMVPNKGCCFVQFTNRQSCEMAADKTFNKLELKGRRATVRWGRSQAQQGMNEQLGADPVNSKRRFDPVPGLPQPLPSSVDFFNLSTPATPGDESTGLGSSTGTISSAKKMKPDAAPDVGHHQALGTMACPPRPFITMPPIPPPFPYSRMSGGARPPPLMPLIVPRIPYIPPLVPPPMPPRSISTTTAQDGHEQKEDRALRQIHYPSQDPQHLGAKDLAD